MASEVVLFRGKRLDNGQWVVGSLVKMGPIGYVHHFILPEYASAFYDIEVDPATVGQYTGLTDKNRKKIFEGDIVRGEGSKRSQDNFVILWSPAVCGFTAGTGKRVWPALNHATIRAYEIVGNIFDNPDLAQDFMGVQYDQKNRTGR